MARDHSLLRDWLGGLRTVKQGPSTMALPLAAPRPLAAVEPLEGRRLLSATGLNAGALMNAAPSRMATPAVTAAAKGYGVTLQLNAGQAFKGYLGDLVGAKVPTGFKVSASVNWGDGTPAGAGVVSTTSNGNIGIGSSHTYARGENFAISITVTAAPAPNGPVTDPIIVLLGKIKSTAIVSSSGGVTINEKTGVAFTATLGTFSDIAPAVGLHASINWGDGTAPSAGKIISTGISGLDVINFKVAGSHTYGKVGTYKIVVAVTQQSGPAGSQTPIRLIATIDSRAIVTAPGLDLDGTITGTLLPAPTAVTVGALYLFNNATGSVSALGPVAATGRIQLPPFFGSGPVTGTMTLTGIGAGPAGPSGSVTLALAAPVQKGSDPIPATLTYIVTSGTGDFASATGSGTIDVILGPNSLAFTFLIHSA